MTAIIVNYQNTKVDHFSFSLKEIGFIMMEGSMTDVMVTDLSDSKSISDMFTIE